MAIALAFLTTIAFAASLFFHFLSREKQKSAQLSGKLEHAENEINFLRAEKEKSETRSEEKINFLQERILDSEKQTELLRQSQQQLEKQKQEWSHDKETILLQLSSDLIKKNNEQQNQANLEQEETIRKITENLFKNFESVTTKLSALDDEVKKSTKEVEQTKAALLTPGGSGRSSEITLENILKSSNLMEKESLSSVGDYVLQSHFGSSAASEAKRPDAILFLPNDQIAVIDSKSSSYFFEFSEADKSNDESRKKEVLGKIKDMFRRHLEDLKRKDYAKFLFEELRTKNSSDYKIFSIIFLQTEQMLEVVKKADREFEQRAFDAGIIVATPVVLIHLLSNVKHVFDRIKQEKNIEILKVEVRKLLDNLVSIAKESGEVGRSINKALIGYNKLAKNLNRATVLSKNISELGIEGKKSAEVKLLEEEYEVSEAE